jgi:hypothetical protein
MENVKFSEYYPDDILVGDFAREAYYKEDYD